MVPEDQVDSTERPSLNKRIIKRFRVLLEIRDDKMKQMFIDGSTGNSVLFGFWRDSWIVPSSDPEGSKRTICEGIGKTVQYPNQ